MVYHTLLASRLAGLIYLGDVNNLKYREPDPIDANPCIHSYKLKKTNKFYLGITHEGRLQNILN